jgi:hypothetical protein
MKEMGEINTETNQIGDIVDFIASLLLYFFTKCVLGGFNIRIVGSCSP